MKTILLRRKIVLLFLLVTLIQVLSFAQRPVVGRDRSTSTITVTLCKGSSTTLTPTITGCTGPYSYSWSPGGEATASILVSPTVTTAYVVSVTGTNNCTSVDTFVVKVIPAPLVNLGPDTGSCACIQISAGNPGSTYYWNNGSEYNTLNVCTSGTLWVTVSNGMCMDTDTINVTIHPTPTVNLGPDITAGSAVVLNAGNSGSTFSWNTGATTQMITVNTSGNYSVTVTNTAGCSSGDDINVNIKTLTYIPEGFSPNGDGINETFNINGIEEFPKNTFEIFNRWGDKVYTAQPYENKWDGRSSVGLRVGGTDLPVGTYFYILDLGDGSAPVKGTVYLNR